MEEGAFISSLLEETDIIFLRVSLMQSFDKAKKAIWERFRININEEQFDQLRKAAGINENIN